MNLAIISFTKAGSILNAKIAKLLNKEHHSITYYKGRCEESLTLQEVEVPLKDWCKEVFHTMDGIIFIGACAIAVRTIAPFVQDKMNDPLVLVLDEKASFVISLLSGHLGGGNELTQALSEQIGAIPVITTATDVNHKFAVDELARKEKLTISDRKLAKEVSATILDGERIGFVSRLLIQGELPMELEHINEEDDIKHELGICITCDEYDTPFINTLILMPRVITIGVGCRKNTDTEQFESFILRILKENHISIRAVKNIASIDLKENEPCIRAFANKYEVDFLIFSAKQLEQAEGEFEESEFVKLTTGVGNVCERSAMLACRQPTLLLRKKAFEGMTIALTKEKRGIRFE
ncbi:cobalt-precorrin 5A acetaldehyde-lyase [Lachnotalea glycerini]|uniref:Cobalamin biosynthesis protein CbiG n=1 Tax=Lachnotalea glycerini TaxID=1763509 RepID=A0A255IX08_9FIRM|nr:cobalt-precorrin 5A hydrolase [Lachnotalea glycerini]PXV95814.1 cobalt-precorrin 5A acetaldehyde-lyase [Lachnotalea glycerini]RDY33123.1 cobalamin biosynthesis protein CbiG [Lachnotalea glycerini]